MPFGKMYVRTADYVVGVWSEREKKNEQIMFAQYICVCVCVCKSSVRIYTKLNMPILRANYVKESRSMELAMFRNVYNQNGKS